MTKKVKLGLRELSFEAKIQTARDFICKMQNNVNFPNPEPALSEIEEALDSVENKNGEIQNEKQVIQKLNTELKNYESELNKKLTLLGAYVESRAKGNIDIIHSAGMEARAEALPLGVPPRVRIKSVRESGIAGELRLSWEKAKGAKVYNVEISDDSKKVSQWKMYDSTTKTKILINNLISGTKYRFRVQAFGSAGKGAFSETVVKYAP